MNKIKVIAILSCARSGSTLLDIILSNHANIVSGGELSHTHRFDWLNPEGSICTCGEKINACNQWAAIFNLWLQQFGSEAIERYAHLQNKFEYAWHPTIRKTFLGEANHRDAAFDEYLNMTVAMFDAIREVSGSITITDSSKDHIRAISLQKHPMIDLRVIHLIRDPRGVVWSTAKTKSREKEYQLPVNPLVKTRARATINWVTKNLMVERLTKRIGESRSVRVIYEELVNDPVRTLDRVGQAIDEDLLDLGKAVAEGKKLSVDHLVNGNYTRMDADFRLKPDYDWTQKMPPLLRETVWFSAGWFARRYGYKRRFSVHKHS